MNPRTSTETSSGDARASLDELIKQAAAKDAIRDFNAAAELYSEATELQARLNGELALGNADLLFAYGKALYNVAVSKSDVLGSKVAGESQAQPSKTSLERPSTPSRSANDNGQSTGSHGLATDASENQQKDPTDVSNKPYFQFTGDENFDDSDLDDEDDEEVTPDDDDDFANAFEVLDLARILYHKRSTALEEEVDKEKDAELSSDIRHVKERLADTYDLQAEISLEAERFLDAVTDLRVALELRQSLFPTEDPSVAECHYKLSLALEFGSVHSENDESHDNNDHRGEVGKEMRKEAALQMERAIESCRLRMDQEQQKLDDGGCLNEDKFAAMKRKIINVRDIIADMEQRLIDLRRPPVSTHGADDTMLKGILGQIVGQAPSDQQARLDAVTKGANDLSAFIKRKPAASQSSQKSEPLAKRSAQQDVEGNDTKRPRVSDTSASP